MVVAYSASVHYKFFLTNSSKDDSKRCIMPTTDDIFAIRCIRIPLIWENLSPFLVKMTFLGNSSRASLFFDTVGNYFYIDDRL